MTKKERKKYGLLPPKIAESDTVSLVHGLCGSSGTTLLTYVYKTIMALKPNQLQVTTITAQANAIIERVHKVVVCQ
jgi:hypothetical protein